MHDTKFIPQLILSSVPLQTVLFNQGGSSSDRRVVTEAALSSSVVHPNVVSTYHYDIKPVKAKVADSGSLQIEHGSPGDWKLFLVQVWGCQQATRGGCMRLQDIGVWVLEM